MSLGLILLYSVSNDSLGMAATRARQVDTATRVGGTYLKVSMMQGVRVLLDFLSNTS